MLPFFIGLGVYLGAEYVCEFFTGKSITENVLGVFDSVAGTGTESWFVDNIQTPVEGFFENAIGGIIDTVTAPFERINYEWFGEWFETINDNILAVYEYLAHLEMLILVVIALVVFSIIIGIASHMRTRKTVRREIRRQHR